MDARRSRWVPADEDPFPPLDSAQLEDAHFEAAIPNRIIQQYAGRWVLLRGETVVADGDTRLFAKFTIGALKEILLENAMAQKPYGREEIVEGLFVFLQRGYLRIEPRPAAKADPDPEKPAAKRSLSRSAAR